MLADYSYDEMKLYAKVKNLPLFRGEQIFDAISAGKTLDDITNIPKALKEQIEEDYPRYKIEEVFESKDGTKKYIISYPDGNIVESVLMKYKYGYTVCLSTQVGCFNA